MSDEYMDEDDIEQRASIQRLSRDLLQASATMSDAEARYLVDAFYLAQEARKRLSNQAAAMAAEPHTLIVWQRTQQLLLENQIKRALDAYSDASLIGRWAKANMGIGPVIAAGLRAHIDIRKAKTVGQIWRFAGVDPTVKWLPKTKRPWNADLKVLVWKIGQSFQKNCNKEPCTYGHEYTRRKKEEIERNEKGMNRERSAQILKEKNFNKKTEAYKAYSSGKFPPAHIDARARRYAAKLFLSHFHFVWHWVEFGELAPNPYAIGHMDHTTFIPPQHLDMVDGLEEAMRRAGL